jgi:glycosyltransferase involved in cell wall biosynthesis
MRLLHVINNLNKGGAERLLVDTLPMYSQTELEASVLQLNYNQSSEDYIQILEDSKVRCYTLGSDNIYSPVIAWKLYHFLKKKNYDVIHVHLFPALYWVSLIARLLSIKKLVYTEHSTSNSRSRSPFLRFIEKWAYRPYDCVVAISDKIKIRLDNLVRTSEKIVVIRNGINVHKFSSADKYTPQFFEQEFRVPLGSVCLMMTARFAYPKDHKTLIDALHLLPKNYYLFLVGDGPDKNNVSNYVENSGLSSRVGFLGFRMDVASLMKSVHLNILSSKYEGMSGVTLEALSSGQLFLGSDVPGINDVVPDRRFLFASNDPVDLANKIITLTTGSLDENHCLTRVALNHVMKFDISKMISEHLALYKNIL